jgi:large subunit ribosomal protein L5
LITNQQPVFRTAKNSIAAFKLREGMKSSCMVTLRKKKMYNFLHRLISFNLTQIRNFRGLSMKGFNKDGVYSFGVSEQVIFPEIDYSERSFGCGITIVTSARSVAEAKILFEALGIPLRQQ